MYFLAYTLLVQKILTAKLQLSLFVDLFVLKNL